MDINNFTEKDILIISPEGRIDSTNSNEFESSTMSMSADMQKIAIDFTNIKYISSAGLRSILVIAKEMNKSNRKFVIFGMNSSIKDVFDMAGFSSVIKTSGTKDDAIAILN